MPDFASFAAFHAELTKAGKELALEEKRKITHAMGVKAKAIADAEVTADLGSDHKYSHWAPVAELTLKSTSTGDTILMPTRTGAGPWTVVNQGRNNDNASGFSGPGVNRRSGVTSRNKSGALRKVRATKGKRWNGTTTGKGTSGRSVRRMETEIPKIAEDGVRKVLQRHFDVT